MEMKDLKRKIIKGIIGGQAACYYDKDKSKPIPNFEEQALLRITTTLAETRGVGYRLQDVLHILNKRCDGIVMLLVIVLIAVIADIVLHFIR